MKKLFLSLSLLASFSFAETCEDLFDSKSFIKSESCFKDRIFKDAFQNNEVNNFFISMSLKYQNNPIKLKESILYMEYALKYSTDSFNKNNSKYKPVLMISSTLSDFYYSNNEIEKYFNLNNKLLDLALKFNDSYYIGLAYSSFANYYIKKEDFNKALEYALKSIDYITEDKSEIFNTTAFIYTKLSQYDNAIDFYNKSIDIKTKKGNLPGLCITNKDLGLLYFNNLHDLNKSQNFLLDSSNYCKDSHEYFNEIYSYLYLGLIAADKKDFSLANVYYTKSETLLSQNKSISTYDLVNTLNLLKSKLPQKKGAKNV